MSLNDPFYVVREEVERSVKNSQALYDRWKDLLASQNIADNDEYEWTKNELQKVLRSIDWDLQDLDETIRIAESNPGKFKLSREELASRRMFVNETRHDVSRMKEQVNNPAVSGAQTNAKRGALLAGGQRDPNRYTKMDDATTRDNQNFIEGEGQRQKLIMQQQDQQLDGLSEAVGRLGEIGQDINIEITHQNRLLEEIDNEADTFQGKMDRVMKKLDKIIGQKDRGKICIIFLLMILLIVLAFLVFYA
eukprot:TRINITY_DN15928_c0_g1_i1.p1 TRINITY_DN15928_c0_g1~~TRINITY_DN15928_c0_g1_i1.p1  ORF type:complete len:249 (-),score=45.71 TRINITY_DN15928_c0_g1_i1:14-760(-)